MNDMDKVDKHLFEILTELSESEKPIFLEELNVSQYAVLLYFLKYNPLTNATKNVFRLQLEAHTLPADLLALILRYEILDNGFETGK